MKLLTILTPSSCEFLLWKSYVFQAVTWGTGTKMFIRLQEHDMENSEKFES